MKELLSTELFTIIKKILRRCKVCLRYKVLIYHKCIKKLLLFGNLICITTHVGGDFHILGIRGCVARQGVLFDDICSLRVYFFASFSCLCSLRYTFKPHSKLCVPSGYTITRFLVVFYVLSRSGSSSPDGTPRQSWYLVPPSVYDTTDCDANIRSIGSAV